jgi:cyclomaltodextrinase / maltogenic alpha-amylase / neopullulanase
VINRTTMSSATEYAVMHGVREWFSGGDSARLEAALRLHRHNCCSRSSPHTFLGNHDFARLADTVPAVLLPAAYCVLLTLPGIPAIYYGDELAATSDWSRGGSDAALRPAMSPHDLHDLADGSPELLAAVRELGAFRHANSWLTSAVLDDITTYAGALTYVVTGDGGSIRVHVNATPQTVQFPADEERPQLVLGTATTQPSSVAIPPHRWAVHRTPAR